MRMTRMLTVLVVGVALLAGTGCEKWQEKYEVCVADLDACSSDYADLQMKYDAAKASAGDVAGLKAQLASCQQQLSKAKSGPSQLGGEAAAYDAQRGTLTVTLSNTVLFDAGRTALKSAAKTRLGKIAGELKGQYANKEVVVVGHTDTDPIRKTKDKWADNWELSCERSLAVTRYLISQGVDAKRLMAAGRGEHHSKGSKAESRRVEIVVYMF